MRRNFLSLQRAGKSARGNTARNRMMNNAVSNNATHHRYELNVDGHIAATYYKIADGVITFIHTEVPPELGGKGIGSGLIKASRPGTIRWTEGDRGVRVRKGLH